MIIIPAMSVAPETGMCSPSYVLDLELANEVEVSLGAMIGKPSGKECCCGKMCAITERSQRYRERRGQ
jgi:hypothetical protein